MPTGESGQTTIPIGLNDPQYNAQQRQNNEIARTGAIATQIGDVIQEKDILREKSEFQGFVNQQKADQRTFMESTNDYNTYGTEWEKRQKAIGDKKNAMSHRGSREWADNQIKQYDPLWKMNVDQYTRRTQVQAISDTNRSFMDSIASADYTSETDFENSLRKDQKKQDGPPQPSITENEYKEMKINETAQEMVDQNIWSPQQAEHFKAGALIALVEYEKAQIENLFQTQVTEWALTPDADGKPQGWDYAAKELSKPETIKQLQEFGIPLDDAQTMLVDLNSFASAQKAAEKQAQEAAIESFDDKIYELEKTGDVASLEAARKQVRDAPPEVLSTKQRREYEKHINGVIKGIASAEDVVTDQKVKTALNTDVLGLITGSKTRKELTRKADEARYIKKTLSPDDYDKLMANLNTKWSTAYGHQIGQVNDNMRGMLLNPDSLGYIRNAPIRHKIYGEAQQDFMDEIAKRSEAGTLKVNEIYEIGRTIAATHQISDEEAERQEEIMNEGLKTKESGKKKLTPQIARKYLDLAGGDRDQAKKLAFDDGYIE